MEKGDLLTTSTTNQSAMIGKACVPCLYDINFSIRVCGVDSAVSPGDFSACQWLAIARSNARFAMGRVVKPERARRLTKPPIQIPPFCHRTLAAASI